jgi:4-hydroxybenzoate polyprenyltransferase
MGQGAAAMSWRVALTLGRVSNLPTVWTNALTGIVLAGGITSNPGGLTLLLLSLSLLYIGGMFLNDAFDAEIDARERTSRPIPQGLASRAMVFGAGFAMLGFGLAGLSALDYDSVAIGLLLAGAIVLYDWLHKRTELAPVIMGLCRALILPVAAHALQGAVTIQLLMAAIALFCYVAGLTYAARQEAFDRVGRIWPLAILAVPFFIASLAAAHNPAALPFLVLLALWTAWAMALLFRRYPGDVGQAVSRLIAGISLLDAVLIAASGALGVAVICLLAFGLTLAAQRYIPGT